MARVTQRHIDPRCLRDPRNATLLAGVPDAPLPPLDLSKPNKAEIKLEKQLQAQCENWLRLHGYERMHARLIAAAANMPERWLVIQGWFGHWFKSQRNPLMPDLFICDRSMTRCLMLELKILPPRYEPGQRELIEAGRWREANCLEDAIGIIRRWEEQENHDLQGTGNDGK